VQLADLFRLAIERDASDVLLTAGSPPSLRIGGHLLRVDLPPLSPDEVRDLTYRALRPEGSPVLRRSSSSTFPSRSAMGGAFGATPTFNAAPSPPPFG